MMIRRFVKSWIWSGIDKLKPENIGPIRITNGLSLLAIIGLLLQLPLLFVFWQAVGMDLLIVLIVSVVLLLGVPVLNSAGFFRLARFVLSASFCGYICASTLLWRIDLGTQVYLLLGAFVTPFLFYPTENLTSSIHIVVFVALFLILELLFILPSDAFALANDGLPAIKSFNLLLLASCALICSLYIRRNTHLSWLKQFADRQSANRLLAETFPTEWVHKLKNNSRELSRDLPQVTVLFADIQGFTQLCQAHSTQQVVTQLDSLFRLFDEICKTNGLEKIKTIGDEYMAVSGAPDFDLQHAVKACACALEMQRCYDSFSQTHNLGTGLRIGLASGNVVAGVIGRDKYSYDVWGNAVNIASRMQSQGESGKVQVNQVTAELAMHAFQFSLRGELMVKGIGKMKTFWLAANETYVRA